MLKPGNRNNQIKIHATEPVKVTAYTIVQMIEYEHNLVVCKSIMKKHAGSVNIIAFDEGKGLDEKSSPFDTFVQIIDGIAEIVIDSKSFILKTGEGIIIPAHLPSYIKPNGRFKMLSTTIKSGYE